MRFGPWHRIGEAGPHAPAGPSVFQVRQERGLVQYPTGRSAMIHYGAAANVRDALGEFVRRHGERPWLIRFARDPVPAEELDAALARLVSDFTARFGAKPSPP